MPEQKDKILSLAMIVFVLIIVGFFIYNLGSSIGIWSKKNNPIQISSEGEKYVLTPLINDPIKGSAQALINIYIFADHEERKSKLAMDVLNQLYEKYPDKINLIWKDLPLSKNFFAKSSALAARCAGEQNKYWEYNQQLLDNQNNLSFEFYQQTALELEINLSQFLECYQAQRYLIDIEYNSQEAYYFDIEKVPTIFINQSKFEQEISLENLESVIQNYIK